MDKEVKITKQQFIASIQLASVMLNKGNQKARKASNIINSLATEAGPHLKEDWFVNINLEDYENAMYEGENADE